MLFEEQIARKPDLYPWTQKFIHSMWDGFWTPEEFNFRSDYNEFKTELTDEERKIVTRTLSAIGQIEIAVKTFWADLGKNLPHPSIKDMGYVMANTEVIHNLAYEKLLDVMNLSHVFEENLKEPVVKGRIEYLRKYLEKVYKDDRKQYIYSIILFTLFVENVSLFSQFFVILHLNRNRSVLKDTAQQIQYTRNEEMIHAQVGIRLVNTLRDEYPELFDAELEARISEECLASIEAESKVIDWIVGDYHAEGREENEPLNADILKNFIRKRMAESLDQINFKHDVAYDKDLAMQSYWFEQELYGVNQVDFFQKRPVDYAKGKGVSEDELF